jgi:hypothetical protein
MLGLNEMSMREMWLDMRVPRLRPRALPFPWPRWPGRGFTLLSDAVVRTLVP